MANGAEEVLSPGTGLVFISTGPSGSTATMPSLPIAGIPATYDADWSPSPAWKSIGHTSLENGITIEQSGDDPETQGTWQVPSLRQTTPTRVRSMVINLNSFTLESYRLYYGGGFPVTATGDPVDPQVDPDLETAVGWAVPDQPVPQEHSLLIIAVDGEYQVTQYIQRASIVGGDSMELDPASLSQMPVRATILSGGYIITPRMQTPPGGGA